MSLHWWWIGLVALLFYFGGKSEFCDVIALIHVIVKSICWVWKSNKPLTVICLSIHPIVKLWYLFYSLTQGWHSNNDTISCNWLIFQKVLDKQGCKLKLDRMAKAYNHEALILVYSVPLLSHYLSMHLEQITLKPCIANLFWFSFEREHVSRAECFVCFFFFPSWHEVLHSVCKSEDHEVKRFPQVIGWRSAQTLKVWSQRARV